jgi:aminopeptidase N
VRVCVYNVISYLGEETFSRSLHNYLNRHIYNNTVTEDLWAALTELSGKPIATLMDPWVSPHPTFPSVVFPLKRIGGGH